MKYKQFVINISYCFCLILMMLWHPYSTLAKNITISTTKGAITYSVELANTPALQKKGLMERKSMPQNHGMLFIFDQSYPISMWMKNTYIPLDMIFVDEKGIIRYIHENAQPLDETIIASPLPVKYVIELNAGQVDRNQIQTGNEVKDIQ